MKKLLSGLLAASLLLSLAACSKQPSAQQSQQPQQKEDTWSPRKEKTTAEEVAHVPTDDEKVTIQTACGDITGVQYSGYREFRGVRYATAARWEDAVPVTSWSGTYDATVWGDRACQYKGFYGIEDSVINQFYADEAIAPVAANYSEDCLNLNIWTPDDAKDCPVLVYIHGGAYVTGSNTDTSTDGAAYANHGIVTVAINYRLGPFATPVGDGYTGYMSISDQVAALHWVRDNIKDYGGDPSKITVMGESAGAISVQNLLISPLVEEGLISGAIMMSGGGDISSIGYPAATETVKAGWDAVKLNLGVDSLKDLTDLDAKELYGAWLKAGGVATPNVNGVGLTCDIKTALKENTVKDVPCIIGMLSEDMWPLTLYDAAKGYGEQRAKAGGKSVYLYYFDRQQPGENKFGAFHAADLYYAFGTLYRNQRPFDETDFRISHNMIDYIANFVKTGDPNGEGLAAWVAAAADKQEFLHFGDDECAMMQPDSAKLLDTQTTGSPFPYTNYIKSPDTAQGERTPIDPADLAATWVVTGWIVQADQSFAAIAGEETFVFTADHFTYNAGTTVKASRDYTFIDEYNIRMEQDGQELVWTLYLNEKGQLLIDDPRYAITYVCVLPGSEGGETGGEQTLPKPFYKNVTAVKANDLLGTWDITGWTVKADGSFSKVTDQTFKFEEKTLRYYTGSKQASASAYYFEDTYNIGLRAEGASKSDDIAVVWTLYFNDKGQLLIEDPTYGIIYVCEKQGGAEPSKEPEVSLPKPFYKNVTAAKANDLLGTWDITGWTVKADGSFSKVTDQTFKFEEKTLRYYTGSKQASASAYYFEDTYNIGLRAEGASKSDDIAVIWTLYFNDKGQLLIEDPTYGIIYVCEKQGSTKPSAKPSAQPSAEPSAEPSPEPSPEPSAEPSAEPTPEPTKEPESNLPKPFYKDVTAAKPSEILGTWNITGWTVKADGSFSPVSGQTFKFEEKTLRYFIGAGQASASGYFFEDDYNIGLRAEGASKTDAIGVIWTLYFNDKGQLLIEDPSYGIIYVCEKQ